MQLLTCQVAPPSLQKKGGPGRPKKCGAAASGSQPARSQTTGSDGNRRFPTRARKSSKRKQGIPSDKELGRESSILKKAAKERQEEVGSAVQTLPSTGHISTNQLF